MKIRSMTDLLLDQIQDLYGAENQLIKALPKMAKAASTESLRNAFQEHLETTRQQKKRLEQVFAELDKKPKAKKCKGMEGLLEEGKEMMEEDAEPAIRDAGLIAAAQRVEHYEIAGYGTVRTLAQQLGLEKAAQLLQQTLDEEGYTDQRLTDLAESQVNIEAERAGEERGATIGRSSRTRSRKR